MIQQAPVFIVLLPLTAALFCMLVSKFSKRLGSLMVLAAIAGAFSARFPCFAKRWQQASPCITGWAAGLRRWALNLCSTR